MEKLKKISLKVADFQAVIILTLVYSLLGVFIPLRKKHAKSGWLNWQIKSDSLEDLKRQF